VQSLRRLPSRRRPCVRLRGQPVSPHFLKVRAMLRLRPLIPQMQARLFGPNPAKAGSV
jgi:hypothetical protein